MAQCKLMDKKELIRLNNGKKINFKIAEHLGTRVRNGTTRFTFYYKVEGKKHAREMVLGVFPQMSLAQANKYAIKYNKLLENNQDPLEVCRCTPVKNANQKQANIFTYEAKTFKEDRINTKHAVTLYFKTKESYEHFLALLTTIEKLSEDISSCAGDARKLIENTAKLIRK